MLTSRHVIVICVLAISGIIILPTYFILSSSNTLVEIEDNILKTVNQETIDILDKNLDISKNVIEKVRTNSKDTIIYDKRINQTYKVIEETKSKEIIENEINEYNKLLEEHEQNIKNYKNKDRKIFIMLVIAICIVSSLFWLPS